MIKILFIDSNNIRLAQYDFVIRGHPDLGVLPYFAESGMAGVDMASYVQPDLILCDHDLHDLSMDELKKRLQGQLNSHISFLVTRAEEGCLSGEKVDLVMNPNYLELHLEKLKKMVESPEFVKREGLQF